MTSKTANETIRSAITRGVHHVGLTVSDLEGARAFFESVLGFSVVAERLDYPAVFVSDGVTLITLWRVEDPDACTPFDRRKNVGLHHLALRVPPERLSELSRRVSDYPGAELEFAPESLGSTGLTHMMCRIPGGPRVELVGAEG